MRRLDSRVFTLLLLSAAALASARAQTTKPSTAAPAEPSGCITCHGETERWDGPDRKFFVDAATLTDDVHLGKGISCHNCHGGDPLAEEFSEAHTDASGFKAIKSPKDIPDFCGKCHSSIDIMRQYRPSARTDQVSEYWTSGHGKRLRESGDPKVAVCTSCHGGHGIKSVEDLTSPVYPTNVAKTCSKCHADAERMNGYLYKGKQLSHTQFSDWKASVHGKAMLEKGDISAPTCNDCHGNHGAVPPEVGSVANACGTCHGKVAELFQGTLMKHKFAEVGLPGCATCHGTHGISHPTDEMLGMGDTAVCAKCHPGKQHEATAAGAETAHKMRTTIEDLKAAMRAAESKVAEAGRLGMEVRGAKFEMAKAGDALTRTRTMVHTFSAAPFEKSAAEGKKIVEAAAAQAEAALLEHKRRRFWLGGSLAAITAFVGFLLYYIRKTAPVGSGTGVN